MKNITLSAEEGLLDAARRRAIAERTTLNEQFRQWSKIHVRHKRRTETAMETIAELKERLERYRFGTYASLIVASALDAGCSTLFSEDLQDGQSIGGLTIRNPLNG